MMKKTYYLFNPGVMSRKDNTLQFQAKPDSNNEKPRARYIPINGISDIYLFGSVDANAAMYNFLGKQHISVHFFDYYEHYTGSFLPKEYLLAGKVLVKQVKHYESLKKRLILSKEILLGAHWNIRKNLMYYAKRDRNLNYELEQLEVFPDQFESCTQVDELMGFEGQMRTIYYQSFDTILTEFKMNGRSKQPPKNEVNALISFANMMCYTLCLSQLYHTQLNSTISYLHEPGVRRHSLALDLAEIFKPLLVDRLIFRLINKKEIRSQHFDYQDDAVFLKESGKKILLKTWEERLHKTIKHRKLGRNVSYKRLIRLECYKLVKHLMNIEPYVSFKSWW